MYNFNWLNRVLSSKYQVMISIAAVFLITGALLPSAVVAQDEYEGVTSALLEEVIVTSRKRSEPMQDVPLSISAYSADQLEALKIRDLGNLSVGMPNVALDDIGTFRAVANFSIRGLGVNSSIPSIDPTVGVSSATSTKIFLSTYPTKANSPQAIGSMANPSNSCGVPEARAW